MKNKKNKPIEEMTDDELNQKLATMKRLPRGSFQVAPSVTADPRKTKVRVTIYLDADVLDYFKERAAQPSAAPYQTQINQALREVMEQNQTAGHSGPGLDYMQLVQNKKFIAAIAEKVQEYTVKDEHS